MEIAELKAEIADLKQQVQLLTEQLRLARRQQFGASSEKSPPEQLSLFNEAEKEADPCVLEPELERAAPKRKKQKGKREADFSLLPTERIVHELPENEQACSCCGEKMHVCGHDLLRRQIKVIPAKYILEEHMQAVYSCRRCEQSATDAPVPMKKAPVPAPVIKGSGIASPSLLAQIANQKYTLGLPLYRQEQEFKRNNIPINRQNMANWIICGAQRWLKPLYDTLHRQLLMRQILHGDETRLQVLHEEGRKPQNDSYMWMYRTSGDTRRHIVLYEYATNRNAENPAAFLQGFQGYLHTDGYQGYHSLAGITAVGCWAHLRREFDQTLTALDADLRQKHPAHIGLDYCNRLFALERQFDEDKLNPDQRFEQRNRLSKLIAKEFFAWANGEYEKLHSVKGKFGEALTYATGQQVPFLMNVFLDGRLELSNNRAERSIKPFVIGRKNWLFCNTPDGADASAVFYSIIETAKENGLNVFKYLSFLFETLPNLPIVATLDACLPWTENVQALCK
jgi:transposase